MFQNRDWQSVESRLGELELQRKLRLKELEKAIRDDTPSECGLHSADEVRAESRAILHDIAKGFVKRTVPP